MEKHDDEDGSESDSSQNNEDDHVSGRHMRVEYVSNISRYKKNVAWSTNANDVDDIQITSGK